MKRIVVYTADGFEIAALLAIPQTPPKAVVQIIHGSAEHKGRYRHVIDFLVANDFAVIAADLRGHGESVTRIHPRGHIEDEKQLVADIAHIARYTHSMFVDLPLYMIGHSLGSMLARVFLQDNDALIDKLLMTGTVRHLPFEPVGKILSNVLIATKGEEGKSELIKRLANRNSDWISLSKANRETFKKDPLGFNAYTAASYRAFLNLNRELKNYQAYHCRNEKLLIMSLTGEGDPIPGGEAGLREIAADVRAYGYSLFMYRVYPRLRHEVFNEEDNEIVFRDMLNFFAR